MLARLLRTVYLFQVLLGGVAGAYLAVQLNTQTAQPFALFLVPLGALMLPVALQFIVIFVTMLRSRGVGEFGPWWRALWGEFGAALLIFVLRQPWPNRNRGVLMPMRVGVQQPGVPVLLVHGYLCNHRVWDKVAKALQDAGHPVLAMDLEPLFTSIDDYAALVERAVAELLTASGADKLALVGHSMGGLAIRAWMRAHGSARVSRVITLGTPHLGTQIARAAMTPNGAQMVWRSNWVNELQEAEPATQRARWHIALTRHDNIVYPQREQVLAGANVTEFAGMGHLQMCLSPEVIAWLVQTLGADSVPVTSASSTSSA